MSTAIPQVLRIEFGCPSCEPDLKPTGEVEEVTSIRQNLVTKLKYRLGWSKTPYERFIVQRIPKMKFHFPERAFDLRPGIGSRDERPLNCPFCHQGWHVYRWDHNLNVIQWTRRENGVVKALDFYTHCLQCGGTFTLQSDSGSLGEHFNRCRRCGAEWTGESLASDSPTQVAAAQKVRGSDA